MTDNEHARALSVTEAVDALQLRAEDLASATEKRRRSKWTVNNVALVVGAIVTVIGIGVGVAKEGALGGVVVAAGTSLFAVVTRLGWQNHAIQAEKRSADYEYVAVEAAILAGSLAEIDPASARMRLTELNGVMRDARKTFW